MNEAWTTDIWSLEFSGGMIRESGIDAPYVVRSMMLHSADGELLDMLPKTELTKAYMHTDFAKPSIELRGFADERVDTDGDGLFEKLIVSVDVDTCQEGRVYLSGDLYDANGDKIASTSAQADLVNATTDTVGLEFLGASIRAHGIDGPYFLRNVYAYQAAWPKEYVFLPDAYQTGAYAALTFE